MSFIIKFTGLSELHPHVKGLMIRYGAFRILLAALYALSGTIFILHLIDTIGYYRTGMLMSLMILVQFLVDYPSGSLGDYIGQKWVLALANFSSALALLVFAFAGSYSQFIISIILFGFANAQASGALQSWLDSNYKHINNDEDIDRRNYGFTMNRIGTIETLVMGSFIVLGGFLATLISREFVFTIQSIATFIVALLFINYLDNIVDQPVQQKPNFSEYLGVLKKGISVAVSKKSVALFLVGNATMATVWDIWGTLLLIPIYFAYTGSDSLAGILRSTIFFIGVLLSIWLANVAKRTDNQRLPILFLIHLVLLFGSIMLVLYYIPPQNQFNLIGFIVLILVFTFTVSMFAPIIETLIQRIMVDLIPSENRNAIYSLIPSLSAPFRILILPIAGGIIEGNGMIYGVAIALAFSLVGVFCIYLALRSTDTKPMDKITIQRPGYGAPG